MKIQRVLSVLELFGEVTIALFLAGVVVPSFLRSGTAASHDSAGGSLHILTVGEVTFWFTLQNLGLPYLGGVFGVLIALAIEFSATAPVEARRKVMETPSSTGFSHLKRLPKPEGSGATRLGAGQYRQGSLEQFTRSSTLEKITQTFSP